MATPKGILDQAARRASASLRPRKCWCQFTSYEPGTQPDGRLWTRQVTSACRPHFRRLPVAVRVRILLNEGWRLP